MAKVYDLLDADGFVAHTASTLDAAIQWKRSELEFFRDDRPNDYAEGIRVRYTIRERDETADPNDMPRDRHGALIGIIVEGD